MTLIAVVFLYERDVFRTCYIVRDYIEVFHCVLRASGAWWWRTVLVVVVAEANLS
jgi:hypothetical protein